MSKKLLVPVAVILACAVILAAAGAGLAGTAAANAEKELGEMISYLLPGGGEFEEIEYKGTDSKITNVYKGEGGYVLAMTANGYVDEIKLLVAVDNEGVVKGYTVRDIHDTYGLGRGVQDDVYFLIDLVEELRRPRRGQQHRRRDRRYDKLLRRCGLRERGEQVRAGVRCGGRPAHRYGQRLRRSHHRLRHHGWRQDHRRGDSLQQRDA